MKKNKSEKYKLLFWDLLNRVIDDSYEIKKNGDITDYFNYVDSVKVLRESVKYVESGNEKEKYLRYLKVIGETYKYCVDKIKKKTRRKIIMVKTKNSEGYKLIDEYIPVENKTEKLAKAKRAQDDEFYTKREDVENVMKMFEEYKIFDDFDFFVCPCDSEESEFVKLLKEWKKPVVFFQDMDKVLEMDGNFLIFTNPPFSKEIKWFDKITEKGLKFFVLSNVLPGKRNLERLIAGEMWGFGYNSYSFKHPSGQVRSCPCVWLHNIEKIKNVKAIEEKRFDAQFSKDGIPIMRKLADYTTFFDIWKKFSEIYVPITYLYTNGFEGWEAVETRNNIINKETGKREFIKLLIRKKEGHFDEDNG